MLAEGKLEVQFDRAFDLEEVADAHEYVESRQSMGKVVITP
jgi:NADPH2:quinone reductase